jgi:hypothetical protein
VFVILAFVVGTGTMVIGGSFHLEWNEVGNLTYIAESWNLDSMSQIHRAKGGTQHGISEEVQEEPPHCLRFYFFAFFDDGVTRAADSVKYPSLNPW